MGACSCKDKKRLTEQFPNVSYEYHPYIFEMYEGKLPAYAQPDTEPVSFAEMWAI